MSDKKTLEFIYDRMVRMYHESEDADYMREFKTVIDEMPSIESCDECPAHCVCQQADNKDAFNDDDCKEVQKKMANFAKKDN